MNCVFLIGNLTRDPEFKQTKGGMAVAEFGLAVNRRFRNKKGDRIEEVHFFEIETYFRQAEICHQFLSRGKKVALEGRLRQHRWTNEKGENRSRVSIAATRVEFLSTHSKSSEEEDEAIPF